MTGQEFADEFYSAAPKYRTKVRLALMFECYGVSPLSVDYRIYEAVLDDRDRLRNELEKQKKRYDELRAEVMKENRVCLYCSKEFTPELNSDLHCSPECYTNHNSARKKYLGISP